MADLTYADSYVVTVFVLVFTFAGLLFALICALNTAAIKLQEDKDDIHSSLVNDESGGAAKSVVDKVVDITAAISEGANAFLYREYIFMGWFVVGFSGVIILLIGLSTKSDTVPYSTSFTNAVFTAISFTVGAGTSIMSGWIGMRIAVFANGRTTLQARHGYGPAFVCAFKAGCVMGFALTSFGVLILYILMNLLKLHYDLSDIEDTTSMFEAIAGYGLGGSSIALFGRVGGGIYTKAADVGADLCGKLEFDIPEDDPRNPAVIADNVGDNVGDIAGMGADLFGSFAESTCAAMVISSQSPDLFNQWSYICFPLMITSTGIIVCILTSFVATHLIVVQDQSGIEPSLKRQLIVSSILMTPAIFLVCWIFLPHGSDGFTVSQIQGVKYHHIFWCITAGLWSGLLIGLQTEYYTSHAYGPTREVAMSCKTGAATNIIYGLALGYKSVIIPAFAMAVTIYLSFSLAGMYGISMAALGILSTMAIGLTIDAYGPICDNAGGIAEMSGMGEEVRERTDALDSAGNTTAAIGKGFAIGSAAFVSLALFGGFITIAFPPMPDGSARPVDILKPFQFAGLLVGAMLPYWFTAMTIKSVGIAALAMVEEVRRQFESNPKILEGTADPDYALCVDISTQAALSHMVPPGALVIITPILVGYLLGVECLAGVLAGQLVSGVQMAISQSNSGGAWDNAKKYVEAGYMAEGAKGSELHKAAVIGDTVGDPLKDTSGPSLNILIKLSAILSLVFARSFPHAGEDGYLVKLFHV